MPRSSIVWIGLWAILFFACNNGAPPPPPEPTTVEQIQAVNVVFETPEVYNKRTLDSLEIEHFIDKKGDPGYAQDIRDFYQRRDRQYAWFVNDSLSESTNFFLALLNSEDTLHKAVADLREGFGELVDRRPGDHDLAELELAFTDKFFRFASKKYSGLVGHDIKDLDWYIPKRKKNFDMLLDSLVAGRMDLSAIEPLHPQYFLLKDHLKEYYALAQIPWDPLKLENKDKLEPGGTDAIVPGLRERLQHLGDLVLPADTPWSSLVYDTLMVAAVEHFQLRHGLLSDGIVGPNVLEALNVSPRDRLRTLLVNMERMRWMPQRDPPDVLMVNIPEYKLHVYEEGQKRMSMEIVVGRAANRTVIFSDTITYLVFSPTWTIPRSITQNEILPALEKDPDYLRKKNMVRIGGTDAIPIIRQQPGPNNSLGRVKFMFPNSYSIYLHDTPAKSLFARDQRAFSHGCIRVSRPAELAEYLLRNDPEWPPEKIKKAMFSGKEQEVGLKEPRPVMLTYFTAWVDVSGQLNFWKDIYGHDEKLARELFSSEGVVPDPAAIALGRL